MRLTMILIGAAALAAGIFSSTHRIEASAVGQYGVVETYCGTAFDQRPARSFFPELAEACASAAGPWPGISILLYAVAAAFLIRMLYMMIGPKTSAV